MNKLKTNPSVGDLRVWWCPQIPMTRFFVDVASPQEAKKLLDVLADYDMFQFENNVKGDYCNAGGLEVFEDVDEEGDLAWYEWSHPETGEDIDEVDFTKEAV